MYIAIEIHGNERRSSKHWGDPFLILYGNWEVSNGANSSCWVWEWLESVSENCVFFADCQFNFQPSGNRPPAALYQSSIRAGWVDKVIMPMECLIFPEPLLVVVGFEPGLFPSCAPHPKKQPFVRRFCCRPTLTHGSMILSHGFQ